MLEYLFYAPYKIDCFHTLVHKCKHNQNTNPSARIFQSDLVLNFATFPGRSIFSNMVDTGGVLGYFLAILVSLDNC